MTSSARCKGTLEEDEEAEGGTTSGSEEETGAAVQLTTCCFVLRVSGGVDSRLWGGVTVAHVGSDLFTGISDQQLTPNVCVITLMMMESIQSLGGSMPGGGSFKRADH